MGVRKNQEILIAPSAANLHLMLELLNLYCIGKKDFVCMIRLSTMSCRLGLEGESILNKLGERFKSYISLYTMVNEHAGITDEKKGHIALSPTRYSTDGRKIH